MLRGFKKFIARGNMIDMAVAVVMGAAVTKVVNSLVKNLISPLIAMIFGEPDMSRLLRFQHGNSTIAIGAVLTDMINFFIVAIALYFFIIVPINKIRDLSASFFPGKSKKEDNKEEEVITKDDQIINLLAEIRDTLHTTPEVVTSRKTEVSD